MKGKDDRMSSRTGLFAEQERRYLYYAILEVHQSSLDSLKAWPKSKENGAIKSALAQIRSFWTRTIGVSLQLNQSDPYLEDEKAVTLLYIVIVQPRFSFNGILGPRNALTSPSFFLHLTAYR